MPPKRCTGPCSAELGAAPEAAGLAKGLGRGAAGADTTGSLSAIVAAGAVQPGVPKGFVLSGMGLAFVAGSALPSMCAKGLGDAGNADDAEDCAIIASAALPGAAATPKAANAPALGVGAETDLAASKGVAHNTSFRGAPKGFGLNGIGLALDEFVSLFPSMCVNGEGAAGAEFVLRAWASPVPLPNRWPNGPALIGSVCALAADRRSGGSLLLIDCANSCGADGEACISEVCRSSASAFLPSKWPKGFREVDITWQQ